MQPLEKSLGILGISKTASLTELKAAYRFFKEKIKNKKTASLTELKAAYRFRRFVFSDNSLWRKNNY